jgi:hypothetical protein
MPLYFFSKRFSLHLKLRKLVVARKTRSNATKNVEKHGEHWSDLPQHSDEARLR